MCALFKNNYELATVLKQSCAHCLLSPAISLHVPIRDESTNTSSTKTMTWRTLRLCREVALSQCMLSDWTLYVALSCSCPYCMRCSEWKQGLKDTVFCLGVMRPFLVTSKPQRSEKEKKCLMTTY